MKRPLKLLSAVAASALLLSIQVQAHGIWFAERAAQTALLYGVGADDLDIVKRLPLLQSINGYDADLHSVGAEAMAVGPLVLAVSDDQPVVYTAVLDNGIWSKTPDGKWHKKGKDEVPNAVVAEHTVKYAVHIKGKLNKPMTALPSQTLQVVPVTFPLPEKMGDKLELQVLLNGKPVKGAAITRDFLNDPDAKPVHTDNKGHVIVKVRNQGLNVIRAVYEGPADDPVKVTRVEHTATLSFALGHAPE